MYAYTCTWYKRMNDLSKTKETYLVIQDSGWVLHGPFSLLNGICVASIENAMYTHVGMILQ